MQALQFRRRSRKQQREPRPGQAQWRRLAAATGVAAVLALAAALHPDLTGANSAFALGGGGSFVMNGGGSFTLCAYARAPNCVIDGDTIRYDGIKIRLEDIDAPEVFSPKCASELARGGRATRRLLELINAGPFELLRAGDRDEDRYGRKLRTLERAGRSLGAILVAEGLARPWDGARRSWCG